MLRQTQPDRFRVLHDERDGRTVLTLSGDLDTTGSAHLAATLTMLRPLTLPVTVDMSGVRVVDAAGIYELLVVRAAASDDEVGRVRLVGVHPGLARLLDLNRFARLFDLQ